MYQRVCRVYTIANRNAEKYLNAILSPGTLYSTPITQPSVHSSAPPTAKNRVQNVSAVQQNAHVVGSMDAT